MSSEGVRANILVKKPSFGVGNEELLDISFKQFWEHEFQESRPVVCFTDSQLKARDERIARAAFKAGRESLYSGEVDLARAEDQDDHGDEFKYQIVESYINSEEFRKV